MPRRGDFFCRAAFHPRLADRDEESFYFREIILGHDGCLLDVYEDLKVIIPALPPDRNIDTVDCFRGYHRPRGGAICRLVTSEKEVPACCMISLTKPFGIVQRRICAVQRLFRERRALRRQRNYTLRMIKVGVFLATYLRDQRKYLRDQRGRH